MRFLRRFDNPWQPRLRDYWLIVLMLGTIAGNQLLGLIFQLLQLAAERGWF
jgi:hypothetical protein